MFGYFGIGETVVFRIFVILLCFNFCPKGFAQTTIFQRTDDSPQEQQRIKIEENKILIFIYPNCSWSKRTLINVNNFKSKNPQWSIQIYIMASIKEFIHFVHTELPYLPSNLDYTLDLKNTLADIYNIHKSPTYVIFNQGNIQRIVGYVDLNRYFFSFNP